MADATFEESRLATVFGGSGFLGRHIVRALARRGWRVRVAVRRPDLAAFLRPIGGVGQIEPVQANLRYPASIAAAVEGAAMVVNAAGVRAESGAQTYRAVHVDGAGGAGGRRQGRRRRDLCAHFRHRGGPRGRIRPTLPARGSAKPRRSRGSPARPFCAPRSCSGRRTTSSTGSARWRAFCPSFRCSAAARTRLQPVYAGDVARAAAAALAGEAKPGAIYELGGPQVMTLREAAELVLRTIDRRRLLIGLPLGPSRAIASLTTFISKATLGRYPKLLTTTRDQVDLLAVDNVVSAEAEAEGRDPARPRHRAAGGRRDHSRLSCALPQDGPV